MYHVAVLLDKLVQLVDKIKTNGFQLVDLFPCGLDRDRRKHLVVQQLLIDGFEVLVNLVTAPAHQDRGELVVDRLGVVKPWEQHLKVQNRLFDHLESQDSQLGQVIHRILKSANL